MPISNKILGSIISTANTVTTLYTVPVNTETICSTITVCNQGVSTFFSIAIRPNGATLENKHYVSFNTEIDQYESNFLTLGITVSSGDVISVTAVTSNVSFVVFGVEITP